MRMLELVVPGGSSWVIALDADDERKHLADSLAHAKAECSKLAVSLDETKVALTEDAVKDAWAPVLADRAIKVAAQEQAAKDETQTPKGESTGVK